MTRTFRAAAVGAVIALVVAPFLAATSAVAATGQNVLVFVNSFVSDTFPGQEVDQTITALEADDSTVTTFDGGDGSASAWAAALTGIDVIVFPDAEMGGVYYAPGAGSFSYNARDYYPWFGATVDPGEADNVNSWYAVLSQLLALAVDAPQPQPVVDDAPQLAATGAESAALLLAISAALLTSGSALVWVRRRARAV